ncbi:thiol-disulfide oxidoreductase DCC family protein [Leeuwenhoekiella marinoflava]|uniref:thiol-disulfide oxidoreductase DCC family protein n=1 Tax=Leeuwenhoekiella marinoflava TaxID=988 RepID=UPI003002C327
MFHKILKTKYPPKYKPVLIWDGHCGFCKFWITRWKAKTGDALEFKTFQETSQQYKDFPLKEFKKASRLIEPNGNVFSGPDSAYRCYDYAERKSYPYHRWYASNKIFRSLSDKAYNYIAKHRPAMLQLTKILFGNNPLSLKPYWLLYILGIILLFFMVFQ